MIWVLLANEYFLELVIIAKDKGRETQTLVPAFTHDIAVFNKRTDPDSHGLTFFKLKHDHAHLRILIDLLSESVQKHVCVFWWDLYGNNDRHRGQLQLLHLGYKLVLQVVLCLEHNLFCIDLHTALVLVEVDAINQVFDSFM